MIMRVWNIIGGTMLGIITISQLVFSLAVVALCFFVLAAAINDIWVSATQTDTVWDGGLWQKIALLLIFIRVFWTGRRIRKLEEWIEQLRMISFATASYLEFEYGNRELDGIHGLVRIAMHNLWKVLVSFIGFAGGDHVLYHSYAKRDGVRITLADDLKKSFGS